MLLSGHTFYECHVLSIEFHNAAAPRDKKERENTVLTASMEKMLAFERARASHADSQLREMQLGLI